MAQPARATPHPQRRPTKRKLRRARAAAAAGAREPVIVFTEYRDTLAAWPRHDRPARPRSRACAAGASPRRAYALGDVRTRDAARVLLATDAASEGSRTCSTAAGSSCTWSCPGARRASSSASAASIVIGREAPESFHCTYLVGAARPRTAESKRASTTGSRRIDAALERGLDDGRRAGASTAPPGAAIATEPPFNAQRRSRGDRARAAGARPEARHVAKFADDA